MAHDLRSDRVDSLNSSDPEPPLLDACETVLTRTTSDSSSSITVANNSFHHLELHSPFPDHLSRWTNQQHSLYLSYLEDSFVNELHRSMSLRGWSLQNSINKDSKSRTLQSSINMPRQQSLAIQDSFLKKISHEKNEHMLESTAESRVVAESQLGPSSVEKGNSLTEPNAYDDGLFCDDGIHGKGISKFSKRSLGSLEKHSNCQSFHVELVGSTTGCHMLCMLMVFGPHSQNTHAYNVTSTYIIKFSVFSNLCSKITGLLSFWEEKMIFCLNHDLKKFAYQF